MDSQTQTYYSRNAAALARRYRMATGGISDQFFDVFSGCCKILDVGCGAGRDFFRLMLQGHDAYGADACKEMIDAAAETGRQEGVDTTGRLFHDALPELPSFNDGEFDALVCSAVLMHMPDERLFDAVYGLRRVLRPGGRLLLSIPAQRPGVDPHTHRDDDGRYFADLPPDKLQLLLERVGFRLLWRKTSPDGLGRLDHAWYVFLFELLAADADRPLDRVESILNRDKKDATYKLALFRALADIAQTQYNVARYDSAGRVKVPIEALASKWLAYYWPIIASETFIPQKYGETPSSAKPIAIRHPLQALIGAFGQAGGLPAFLMALKNGQLPPDIKAHYFAALRKIQGTIWNMPVRYAGGGADFSVFGYDRTDRTVTIPTALWRELTLTGSWIQDATVLRWAELTERLSKGTVGISLVVEKLLSISDPERETCDARNLYKRIGVSECVWSNKPIQNQFDVDHVIPFVLWRNNDLWNLLPARHEENNAKRDKLPTQRLLQRRRDAVIGHWEALRTAFPERFDREAANLCGVPHFAQRDWQAGLFSRFSEAVEFTAVQRSVPRWEPSSFLFVKPVVTRPSAHAPMYRQETDSRDAQRFILRETAATSTAETPVMLALDDIRAEAFVRYLPVVGALAAGEPFAGFDIADLDAAPDCPWVQVPESLCGKNRFVVRIAGDSMEPELQVGDWVVFEYHRTPRSDNQIVIANIAAFGLTSDLATTDAVKRLTHDATHWLFRSLNPRYKDIRISKVECAYPILGIMVGRLASERGHGR